ncbi:MAG: hypothetical protein GX567_05040 [Clostridia bacterium]|nr:hypothetical protein [Clostridia bacterium]
MLGKMIKHEWKAMTKILFPANLGIAAITVIGCILLGLRVYESDSIVAQGFMSLSMVFYILCLMAVSFTCVIFIGVRFYKTTYTDEGYLLHTLPVTTHEIILSKLIVGVCWNTLTSLVVMLSVVALFISSGSAPAIVEGMQNLRQELALYLTDPMIAGWVVYLIFVVIISAVYSCLWLFAGISFGQIITKHKVIGAFLGLFIIYFMMQFFSTILIFVLAFAGGSSMGNSFQEIYRYITTIYLSTAAIVTLFDVVLYFFTNHMMKRQLNLD